MADYVDGQDYNNGSKEKVVKEVVVQKEIDPNLVAKAIVEALGANVNLLGSLGKSGIIDKEMVNSFDDKASLSRLADAMLVDRGDNKSNFEDLGNVKETKTHIDDSDKTIDLLSDLD